MSRALWRPVYLALGSNLDDPCAQLDRACASLSLVDGLALFHFSSRVVSAPADGSDQPDYVNAVVAGVTQLDGPAVLAVCRRIESAQGRDHDAERWSARTLDIDVLLLGREVMSDQDLTLPHPRLAERAFVLEPLAEIAPDLDVPGVGRVAALLRALGTAPLQRLPVGSCERGDAA